MLMFVMFSLISTAARSFPPIVHFRRHSLDYITLWESLTISANQIAETINPRMRIQAAEAPKEHGANKKLRSL